MSSARPALRALASARGIEDGHHDQTGREWRETSDATREALLDAMGFEASNERACENALARIEADAIERVLAPVAVWRMQALSWPRVALRIPAGLGWPLRVELELVQEDGHRAETGHLCGRAEVGAHASFELPCVPPEGEHDLRVRLRGASATREVRQRWIVVPRTALTAREALGATAARGVIANLYSVRSERGFGFGDFADLGRLIAACGSNGLDFIGLNPLHALRHAGDGVSPYSPVSRLFRSWLYLDLDAVPELATDADARRLLDSPAMRQRIAVLRAADRIDSEAVRDAKRDVLRVLHRAFATQHRSRDTARGRAHAAYRTAQGTLLDDYATFAALDAWLARDPAIGHDVRRWPDGFRDPRSPEVAAFRGAHAEEIAFERWLQFETDRQFAAAARKARDAGMRIGLHSDLAIGSAPDSADVWAFPGLFVRGASVGAPPDDYSSTGQDWGFPPIDPNRLEADGARFWLALVRASMAHVGAVRIDHALSFIRLYWIPAGRSGSEGAYVRQPTELLLGILALESRRHRALVIGEDLGTVPADLPPALASFGILSSRVLLFERDGASLRPPALLSARALLTADTHDLAPLAGWLEGRDLTLRHAAGQLDDAALAAQRARRDDDRRALLARLRDEGLLPTNRDPADDTTANADEIIDAVHALLRRAPSPLVGHSLDDLAREREPINLPGLDLSQHPSWQRRMTRTLDEILPALESLGTTRGAEGETEAQAARP